MGFLYAFLTQGMTADSLRVLKVGKTSDWDTRKMKYTGLDRPDGNTLIVQKCTHMDEGEVMLINVCSAVLPRHSGREWFTVPSDKLDAFPEWISSTIEMCSQTDSHLCRRAHNTSSDSLNTIRKFVDEYATKNEPIRVEQIHTDYEMWMTAHGEVCTLGKISFGKELSKIPGVSPPFLKKVRGVVARYRTIV